MENEKSMASPELFALLAERRSLLERLGLASICPSKWQRTTGEDLLGDAFDFSVKPAEGQGLLVSWSEKKAGAAANGWTIRIGPGAGGKMRVLSAIGTPEAISTIKDAGILIRDALRRSVPLAAAPSEAGGKPARKSKSGKSR